MLIPLGFIAGLAGFLALPRISSNPILTASFAGAVAVLLTWHGVLWQRARTKGTGLKIEVSLRPQHYLQALAHTSIFVYWGFYWDPIKDAAVLILAQIVFAYAFDMLLSWTRKNEFVLGFGPFPIIYSSRTAQTDRPCRRARRCRTAPTPARARPQCDQRPRRAATPGTGWDHHATRPC